LCRRGLARVESSVDLECSKKPFEKSQQSFIVPVAGGLSIRSRVAFPSSERWSEINHTLAEYFKAGVLIVCVVGPDTDSVQVHYPDKPMRVFRRDEELLWR
jgi:hypothetical protein